MVSNSNLNKAKKTKCDEFYTQLEDIERELRHYDFTGKIIYCNCDNPNVSNFYKYFKLNFHYLNINKLICTGYNPDGNGYYGEFDGENEIIKQLDSNGDFRSEECVEFLKECDVVVTNPPFSLFREFIATMEANHMDYLVIGSKNAITYKEIFPLLQHNKMWLGVNNVTTFTKPDGSEQKFGNIGWFTNIEHSRRNTPIDLYRKHNETDYPKYDNYDAIEVSKVSEIPMDYEGVMGVPITFLDKYCPTQFEIIKFRKGDDDKDLSVNGKCPYFRILIRRR